jgi:hypothetical protein
MIPKPLTLRKDDYKESPDWAERLFTQLNEWLAVVTQALTRGLVRSENMRSTVKELSFTTKTPAADAFPLSVKHDLGQRPTDVWVSSLRTTDNTTITAAWSFTWSLNSAEELSVRFQGLADATPYAARIIIE